MALYLQIIQIFPSLFHLFSFGTSVVMLFNHPLADVRSVADDLIRHFAV